MVGPTALVKILLEALGVRSLALFGALRRGLELAARLEVTNNVVIAGLDQVRLASGVAVVLTSSHKSFLLKVLPKIQGWKHSR